MSKTKEFLVMCAAEAGFHSVSAYLKELKKIRNMDEEFDKEMNRRDKEEGAFWLSVMDGTYWEAN